MAKINKRENFVDFREIGWKFGQLDVSIHHPDSIAETAEGEWYFSGTYEEQLDAFLNRLPENPEEAKRLVEDEHETRIFAMALEQWEEDKDDEDMGWKGSEPSEYLKEYDRYLFTKLFLLSLEGTILEFLIGEPWDSIRYYIFDRDERLLNMNDEEFTAFLKEHAGRD